MMIYAEDGKTLGVYEQTDLKSLLTIKGTLYDPSGEKLLPVNVKGFSGDFRLKDEDGKQWAHFSMGISHMNTLICSGISIMISWTWQKNLAEKEKQLLIALVSFLFVQKRQR